MRRRRDRTSWTRLHLPVCFFLFKLILIFLFIFIYLFISTERAAYLKPLIKQAFDAAQNQNYEGLEAHLETYSLFVPFAFVPTNRPWLQPAEERLTLLDTLLQNDDVPIDIVCKVIKYGGKVRMDSIAIACENNRIDIVRALLDNGLVQVDKLGGMFLLPCFYYSQSSYFFCCCCCPGPFTSITTLEFLQFFIETCGYQPDPESACTLLENASTTAEMATYLLSRSAGILSKDRPFPRGISNKDAKKVVFEYVFSHMGDVPLDEAFNAAIDSDPECTQLVEVFINAGCEITRDIVDRALLVRNDAVVVQLARHGAQITIKQAYAVAELAIAKDVDFVIKTCNVDVNEPFVDGDEDDPSFPSAYSKETTLLHGAVQSCDADTIEVVITNGADVNKIAYAAKLQYQNDGRERKYTPLATLLKSSEYSQVDILPLVRLLVKHGADPRIVCDGNQESVLFLAIAKGFEKVVRLLVEECKIDVNSVDSKVKPAFIAAIEANDKRVIDTFLSFPALDINKPDALGWSPAHHAVAKGNLDLLKKLVARGANIKATNSKGLTPLDIAKRRKERGCASELEKAGTLTPLTTAASSANAGAASEKATLTSCASCGDAVGDTVALLSCFHVMCVTCLAAEESDGKSEISCPFKVDSLLSCGTSVVLKDVRVILNTAKRIKVDVEEEVIKCKTCEQAFNPGHLEDLLGHTHAVEQDVDDGEDGGEDLDDGEDGMDDGDFDEGAEEEAGEDDMDVDGNDNRIGYKVNDIRFSVPGVDDDVDSYSFKSSSPFSMLLDESNKTPMEEHLRFAGNLRKIIGDAVAKLFSRRLQFLDKGDVTSAAQVEADIKAVEQHHDDVAVAQDRLRAAFNALQDKSLRLAIRGKAAESCETIVDELKEMELLNATPCLYGGSSPSTVHWPQFHWLFDREVNLASPSDAFQWSVKFVVNSAVARPPRAAVDLPPHVHLSSDEDVVVTSDGFIVVKRGHVLSKPTDGESSDKVFPFKDQHELFVYTLDGTFVRTIKYPNGLISMSTLGGKGLAVVKNESPTVLSLVDVGSTGEEYDHVDLGDVPVLLDDGSHVKFTKLASSSSTADGSVILLCDVCRDEDDGQPAYSVCLVRWSPITREFEFAVEMAIQSDYEDSNRGTDSELFASGDLKILWFTDAYAYLKENTGRNELYYRLDLASGHAEYFGYRDDPEFVHFAKASAYDPFSHLTLHIVGNSIVSDIVVRQEAMPGQPEEILASFAGLNVDTVDVHKLNAHLEHVDTAALPAVFSGNGEPSIHAIGMGPQGEVVVINISKLYIF